ncbi:MAG TPA: hypothetical protein VHN77_11360 [Phycisphaerales bacterium]|nr:hypothetical protein [Phycisphaerales bacterium]
MTHPWTHYPWAAAPIVCCAVAAHAQTVIDARVVSIAGQSVYIDAGREQGVTPGVRVVMFLANGERLEATIINVTSNNARAELPAGSMFPEVGARCEVTLATEPAPIPTVAPEPPRPVPAHPPWQRQTESRTSDTPLLAPAFGTKPSDRPTTLHGRVYSSLRHTHDTQNESDYTYGRLGTWMELTNPFKDAGRILFQGDINYDGTDITDGSENDTVARIQRLSYARGLEEYSPYRIELGRFYSSTLPELGLVDGVEGVVRFQNGWSAGTGLGFFPVANDERDSGEDYGFYVFGYYQSDIRTRSLSTTFGYQQTWHNGKEDRNLLIARVNSRPTQNLWLYALALVDVYGSGDNAKNNAADITQLVLNASYTINPRTGVSASFTRTTWPELLREEYENIPVDLLQDGYVNRLSGSVWRKITKDIRATARGHYWVDQDDTGSGAELGADWYNVWGPGSSLYGALYYDDSSFTDGYGLRAQVRQDFGAARLTLGYDGYAYTVDQVSGSQDLLRHTVRADVGWYKGNWSTNVDISHNFGDSENSFTLGAYVQYRF